MTESSLVKLKQFSITKRLLRNNIFTLSIPGNIQKLWLL